MSNRQTIDCPQCGNPARVSKDNPYRPFCSRRCKLIDLGDWLDESNRIPDEGGPAGGTPWASPDGDGDTPH